MAAGKGAMANRAGRKAKKSGPCSDGNVIREAGQICQQKVSEL
jgi:hypothetical protein